MKTVLVLYFIVYIIERIAAGNDDFQHEASIHEIYPKKDNMLLYKNLKLLNRKYERRTPGLELKTKKHIVGSDYTVFPAHIANKAVDVPSSPYFPQEPLQDDPKPSVKKVLPDFWSVRKKRSPDENADKKQEPAEVTTEGKKEETVVVKEEKEVEKEKKKEDKPAEITAAVVSEKPALVEEKSNVTVTKSNVTKPDKTTPSSPPKITKSVNATKSLVGNQVKDPLRSGKNKKSKHGSARKHKRSSGKRPKSGSRTKKNASKKKSKRSANSPVAEKKRKVQASRRLIAARDALIENYPYVVSIQKDGEHWCSGALLNQRLVVTTANCVWKSSSISRLKIRACSRHVAHGGQMVRIAEVMKHPQWSIRSSPNYDIALLLTDANVRFSHSCHAVDLPNRSMMPVFEDAWIVSWGAQRRDGVYDQQGTSLQVYHARVLDRATCNNVTMRFGVQVSENFLCFEQIGRRAPCTRDTGAPAVSDGVLWGMASWGIRKMCGTERFPAMFSYVASHSNMDFIINATRFLMSEERLSPFLDRYPFHRNAGSRSVLKAKN